MCYSTIHILFHLWLRVATPYHNFSFWRCSHATTGSWWGYDSTANFYLQPSIWLQGEYMHIVEITIRLIIVVKTAKYEEFLFSNNHTMTTACTWSIGGIYFFPFTCLETHHPQILVVIKLHLRRAGMFATKQPELSPIRGNSYHLMTTSWSWTARGFNLFPLVFVDVIEE